MGKVFLSVVSIAAIAGLAACNKASEPARAQAALASTSSGGGSGYAAAEGGGYAQRPAPRRREAIPDFHGEPMWSDNRQHTAGENAHYHCDKSGGDIGAKSFDDCLTRVHGFLDHPPASALKLVRANGDKLVYDPRANMFAVARKDGAPRTFFKPRNGMDYWKEQQAEADNPSGYRSRRAGGDSGGYSRRSSGGDE